MKLTRRDLQELARKRLREARLLLRNAHYDGAYYLTGLAMECALKACIARQTKRHDFPELEGVKGSYTHDLTSLVKRAGLLKTLDDHSKANSDFAINWAIVKEWKVESRYTNNPASKSKELYAAVTAKTNGVMPWIRQHW